MPEIYFTQEANSNIGKSETLGLRPMLRLLPVAFVLFIALLLVNTYWIAEFIYHPGSPASIHNLYQTDEDYFPITYNLSRGHWSEFSVLESRGCCVFPFPLASMSVHAASLRVFGDYGWLIADLLITSGVIAFLFSLFDQTLGNAYCSALGTLVIMGYSAGPNLLESLTHRLLGTDMVQFYSYRFPRPLVTTLFLLIHLATLAWIIRSASARQLLWRAVVAGLASSILLQGDFHGGLTALLSSAGVLTCMTCRVGFTWPRLLRVGAAYSAAVCLASVPFFYQAAHASSDLKRRWGTYSIARRMLFLPHTGGLLLFGVFCLFALWLLAAWRHNSNTSSTNGAWASPIIAVISSYVVSLLTLPLSSALLGQVIQAGQFLDRAMKLRTLLFVMLLGALLHGSIVYVAQFRREKRLMPEEWSLTLKLIVLLAVLLMPAVYHFRHGLRPNSPSIQVRAMPAAAYEGWPPLSGYRSSFEQLCRFLEGNYGRNRVRVLATFDHQVRMWWQAKLGQPVFLPEPFETVISDGEIEGRLLSFIRLLGFSEEGLVTMLKTPYFDLRFLGTMKYYVDSAHQLAPLSDYDPEQTKVMQEGGFHLAIPRSVLAHLQQEYRNAPDLTGELDLMVLNKRIHFADYHVPEQRFTRVFENEEFEVWQAY